VPLDVIGFAEPVRPVPAATLVTVPDVADEVPHENEFVAAV
jgi:hypothetical protein